MAIITTIETDFSGGGGSRSMYGVSRGQTVKVRPYRYSREGGTRYQSGSLVSGPTVGADVFEHLESMRTGSAGYRTSAASSLYDNGHASRTKNGSLSTGNRTTTIQQVTGQKPWYCDVQIAGFLNAVQQFIKQDPVYKNVKPGMRKDAPDIFMISFTSTAGTTYSLHFNGHFRESGKAALYQGGHTPSDVLDSIDFVRPLRKHMSQCGSTYDIQQGLLQSISHLRTNCVPNQGHYSRGYNAGGYSGGRTSTYADGHASTYTGTYGVGNFNNTAPTRCQADGSGGGSGRGLDWCPAWSR